MFKTVLCFVVLSSAALCQQSTTSSPSKPTQAQPGPKIVIQKESVIVTGTFVPAPLSEYDRSAESFDAQKSPILFGTLLDYLQLDPAVDLQQRGPDGIQADLTILGSTFSEGLVLLNGLRLNDAQSSHHDMDIPLPEEAVSRIEVLHGAGSTFYGADAMAGAVNFITAPNRATELRVRAGGGNQGFNQQHVYAALLVRDWSETIAADRDVSSGFIGDRDYRNTVASSETRFHSGLGQTDVLFAGSDRPFGADQFYGNFPSWERTKNWFASAAQDLGQQTSASFGYRRHSDQFVLFRDDPSIYENNHIDQSWQAALRRHDSIGDNSTVSYGAEAQGDGIQSNNLGDHARNREALYGNVDFRALHRFSLSIGGRGEMFSGGTNVFTPNVAGGILLKNSVKLRSSVSRGFRLPTYTDLYYSDPASLGNPNLKPESSWNLDGGIDWNLTPGVSAGATVFRRWDSNVIDYVQSAPGARFQATNVQRLHFIGINTFALFQLPRSQQIRLGYTFLHGDQTPLAGTISRYVFNYPSHKAVFEWTGAWREWLVARTRVGVTQRFQHQAYPVWDVDLARNDGAIRPYLQLANLSNTGYEEIPGVLMPSRSVIAGVVIILKHKSL